MIYNSASINNKTLLFDGDCSLCVSTVGLFERIGLLVDVNSLAWQDASINEPALAERIKREVLLIENQQVYGGFDAIARMLASRFPWTNPILKLPGFIPMAQVGYQMISLNRRMLAPAGNIPCACDPPFDLRYRAALWLVLLAIAFLGSGVFGASLHLLHPGRSLLALGLQLTLGAGSGWALNFLIFMMVFQKRYWNFVQQCLVVMAIGIFWLMPVALVNGVGHWLGLPIQSLLAFTILGVTHSSLQMFLSIDRRSRASGFPKWVPWLWLLLLESAGIPLFIYFKLFSEGG